MDFSDEFLVNNHIPVFLERLIYSPVTVVGGSLSPLFFLPPRPTGTPPISSAMSRGKGINRDLQRPFCFVGILLFPCRAP